MKNIRYFLEHIVLLALGRILRLLPRRVVLFLGARAGDFIYYCVPVRKSITLEHLRRAFPEKKEADIRGIARKAYQNLGMNSFEHLCLPDMTGDDLAKIVSIENEDIIKMAFERNKGVICVGGHFGNWEYLGGALASKGYPITAIVAGIANPYIDATINKHRKKSGAKILSKGMAVRGMLNTLRSNGALGILIDQDDGRRGIFVDFFNRPCSTARGPAQFALKTGAAMVFLCAVRQEDGSIRAVFERVDIDYAKGATDDNVYEVMQRCTNMLESYVRRYPGQWFWMHRRWKTTPQMAEAED